MGSAVSDKTSQPSASEPNQVSPSSSTSSREFHSGAMAVAISATKSPWALANRRQRNRDPSLAFGIGRYFQVHLATRSQSKLGPSASHRQRARTEIDASMARALHVYRLFSTTFVCQLAAVEGAVRTGRRYENTFAAS